MSTPAQLVAAALDETVLMIQALNLLASGQVEVFLGRRPKPGTQAKRLSINVYVGDPDTTRRPGSTGFTYLGLPIHVHVMYKRQDKNTGEVQTENMAGFMLAIQEGLDLRRPANLSQVVENFFSTQATITDTDTETDGSNSEAAGLDPSIEGFATVLWEFWRPRA